jgi:sugar/nucleoside kinase (ribokinase family)
MNTFLGACVELGPEDIDAGIIADSQVVYLEGYLYDPPRAKEAFKKAAKLAHDAGRKVALSLSDPFCVDRHRDEFMSLVSEHVDILFANQSEITSLYKANSFDEAVSRTKGLVETAALTQSEEGSLIIHKGEVVRIAAEKVKQVVDTTGAGDLYAAGFLYGYTRGLGPEASGRIGAIAAAEVIGHVGARPEVPLLGLLP